MSAGSIVIDLLMKTGAFETDTARAQSIAKKRAAAIDKAFSDMGTKIAVGAGTAGAALVAMVGTTVANAKEISNLAQLSGASAQEFQRFAAAAKSVGIQQEQVGDIFKDFREKIGEFVSTGGGEMKDFFEQIAPKVGVTADAFRNLSGPQALQLYFDSMQKAGLSTEQMSFYLESAANDATKLIPLLRDNGKELNALGDAAERMGVIMDDKAIAAAKEFSNNLSTMQTLLNSVKIAISNEIIPAINALSQEFLIGVKHAGSYGEALRLFGTINPFRDTGGNIKAITAEIESLTAARERYVKSGSDTSSIDTALDSERKRLDYLKEVQRMQALAGNTGDVSDAISRRLMSPTPSSTPWVPKNEEAIKAGENALKAAQAAMRAARAESQQLTQAQSALAEVMASKEWSGFSTALREQIKLAYNQADAFALSTHAASGLKNVQDMIAAVQREADGLTDAQKAFAEVMASTEWARYSQGQQNSIRLAYEELDTIQQRTKAANELKAARESEQQTALDALDDLNRQIEALQIEIAYKKDAATVISVLSIARLKEKAAILEGFDGSEAAIELINREIEAREKLLGLTIQKDEKGDYWTEWLKAAEENMASFDELAGEVSKNFSAQFGSAFEQMIFESQSLGDAITGLTEGMARAVVNALGQMAAQWVATELIKRLASEATTTAVVAGTAAQAAAGVAANATAAASAAATGPAIAASMAPAAVATSVATAGTNTLLAVAGIVAAMALIPKLAGARANGGPVASGQTYLVGERGPELFTPNTSGAIIPNHALGGPAQGGGVTVNLIEDKSRAGQTQERNNNGAREIDVFVSDIMGDGPRSKAMAKAFGLQRRGY